MAFFDELRKNFSDVSETLVRTSETVVKKSGDVLELQKARVRKTALERELTEAFAELGQIYYERFDKEGIPEDLAGLCQKIADARAAVAEAEQMVASLKGTVICSQCQSEVAKDASFCPKCGAPIVHVQEAEAEPETGSEEPETDAEEPASTEEQSI